MRILVLGASGMLGSNIFINLCSNTNFSVFGTSSMKSTINGLIPIEPTVEHVAALCEKNEIDLVINCIALTSIEECESRPEAAWILNADFPREIASYCNLRNIRFIHISTDHFYSEPGTIRNETCNMIPLNQYGFTKLSAEKMVLSLNPNSIILRVNFLGKNLLKSKDSSLLTFMLDKLTSGSGINGFADVFFNPVSAKYISDLIEYLTSAELKGILHVAGVERLSKFEFATKLAERLNVASDLITKGMSGSQKNLVTRPKDLTLDISKLGTIFRLENVNQAITEVIG